MSVLENFKNIPRSPYGGATGLKCNFFFFKFATKSLEKKRGGPVARWGGAATGSPLPILNPGHHSPPFPLSFEPKNSEKKRGVRRRKAAKLCRIAYS